jgi:predicted nuclease of predicted toxin-antitoxin system
MKLLADENIPLDLVRILKSKGHLIETVAEVRLTGVPDEDILRYAVAHSLTILTEDKDFGYWLEFSPSSSSPRAILLRFNQINVEDMAHDLLSAIQRIESEAPTGRIMAVLSPGRLRIREWGKERMNRSL